MYIGMIYVQSTEMGEKYVRFQRVLPIKNMQIGNKRIITTYAQRYEFPFFILYHIRVRKVESLNV